MSRGYSTPIGREFGFELRLRRERSGLRAAELARKLNWAGSTLSRVEAGLYPITETQATRYLTLCGVQEEELFAILDIRAVEQWNPGYWMRPHGMGKLANSLRSLVFQETKAIRSTSYETDVIPGLLQIREYAAALLFGEGFPAGYFEDLLQARLDRQDLLGLRDAPEFIFFLHEQALRLPVGDADVMYNQLLHVVLSMARSNVTIRVVPISAGAQSVCRGSFRLLEYTKEHRPLVHIEGLAGAMFLEDTKFITAYRDVLPKLDSIALSEGQSTDLLVSLASEYERAKGEPNAHLEEEQFQQDR
jgi:transcriptional regulator with XRE-family HTH domain